MDKEKKIMKKRPLAQMLITIIYNPYLVGFLNGTIFKGKTKAICVPGLNCYSCPAAIGACPIGSLQVALGPGAYFSLLYVSGFLLSFGTLFGRFVCGWLCPFGFFQELLYKIKKLFPSRKGKLLIIPREFRWGKYIVLVIFCIALPVYYTFKDGVPTPAFCKLICPAGTFQAGVPLLLVDKSLRAAAGFLFSWKASILAVIMLFTILEYRAFCKFICPLGAIYSIFNKIAIFGIKVDKAKCTNCKACVQTCKMECSEINDRECIRCGECRKKCNFGAI